MSRSRLRPLTAVVLLLLHASIALAEDKKPAIVLPKDGKTVVLSYDPGAGGFIRKGEAPYLKIQADGKVTVTNLHDGTQKEAKLTPKELEELLKFVVTTNDIYALTEEKLKEDVATASAKGPFIAVGGAGTSVITVEVGDKKHSVSFRAAETYAKQYPTVKLLPQFVAVEKKLSDYAAGVLKAKDK
ncbi:MAG: hypothetical protein K8U57_12950 [Planctomycetes bacterium]|nr:hypothetical protein [Planctomycetota bacterium]